MIRDYAVARNDDPETSHQAAESVGPIRESQQQILDVLKAHGPLTDEQILRKVNMSPSGARSRRAELVDRRLVRDSGARGFTAAGRRTIIWEVAP